VSESPTASRFWRRLRPFHFGSVGRNAPRPLGLWISSGYDTTAKKPYLNVTLFGKYLGALYAKEIR